MSKRKPNLLFIWTDEQRADTLACNGGSQIAAPNLNRLADQSTVFRNAYCTQPVCTPSRATILSGLWPHTHGCVTNNTPLKPETKTIAEMVDGYHCAYFGKWHLGDELMPQHGFDQWLSIEDGPYRPYYSKPEYLEERSDYHYFLEKNGFPADVKAADGAQVYSRNASALMPERFTKAGFLGSQAAKFISEYDDDKPFALSVNFLEPHMPFFGPLNDMYEPDDLEVGPAFARRPADNCSLRNRMMSDYYTQKGFGSFNLSTEDGFRRIRANYYGLVSLVDHAVGQMLSALEHSGHHDDTIVVFTSDHGDMMGDQAMLAKCVQYEQSIKIPLMIRAPWLGEKQQLVDGAISQIDLVPTLLELMEQELPDHLQGTSRADVVSGDANLDDNDVIVEWNRFDFIGKREFKGYTEEEIKRVNDQNWRTIVTSDRWKLNLCTTDQCELFNLNDDPHELTNLYDDPVHADRVKDLTSRITAWQEESGDTVDIA